MIRGDSGQVKLSFGMIFSIILIIIFLGFAFFAIKTFLGIQNSAQTGKFVEDFQDDIDRVWRSAQSSETQEYSLPSSIESVCLVDFSDEAEGQRSSIYDDLERSYFGSENLVFYPFGSSDIDSTRIDNIDLSGITLNENPFCINTVDGKVNLRLVKDFTDALVTITR